MKHVEQLKALGACTEAIEWATTQPDWETCWAKCPRGDWLLWTPGLNPKKRVLAACACARLVLHLVPDDAVHLRAALDAAEAWARGGVSAHEVHEELDAAWREAKAYAQLKCPTMKGAMFAAVWAVRSVSNPKEAVTAAWQSAVAKAALSDAIGFYPFTEKEGAVAMHAKCADEVRKIFPAAPALPEVTR